MRMKSLFITRNLSVIGVYMETIKSTTNADNANEETTIEFAGSKIVRREIPTYRRMSSLFLAENRAFR